MGEPIVAVRRSNGNHPRPREVTVRDALQCRSWAAAVHFVALSGLMVAVVSSPAYAGAKPKATPTPKATRDTPVWSPPSYDPNDYTEHIESYDVTLQVRRDGSMHVSEAIKYNFGDGPNPDLTASEHHGIIRKIPTHRQVDDRYDRVIQILHPHVRGEGIGPGDLQVSRSGDDEVLKIGNPDTTVSGVKTYVIDYDVHHALNPRNGGTDELYWDAIGTRWTVPISKATVTMTAPVGISSMRLLPRFRRRHLLVYRLGHHGCDAQGR